MSVIKYIGARYIPIPYEGPGGSNEWIQGAAYDGLIIVTYGGRSYISKKPVPAQRTLTPNEDTEYWVPAALYNADVEEAMSRIEDLEETKADKDGYYPDLWAGHLISDIRMTDNVPYLMRRTGGDLAGVGDRCYDTIVGASVGENQLVQSGATSVTVQSGHKYYAKIDGTESLGTSTGSAITINDSAKDMVIDLSLYLPANIVDYIYSLETATAGAGIAKLRSWSFLRGYQAYNAGSLESVEVTGKKVVGFNQVGIAGRTLGTLSGNSPSAQRNFKETEYYSALSDVGYYSSDSVSNIVIGDGRVSATIINAGYGVAVPFKCLRNVQYCFHRDIVSASGKMHCAWYDDDGHRISSNTATQDRVLTSPDNAKFGVLIFTADTSNTNVVFENICINLSNTDRNGEYEPYTSQTYALGSDTLRGIFKLDSNNQLYADGDRKTSDGVIARKYGTLIINGDTDVLAGASGMPFRVSLPDASVPASTSDMPNAIADKLQIITQSSTWGTPFTLSLATNHNIYFKLSDSISTIEDAKTYLTSNPITLVYELATPTTETSTPFQSPQVCYPDGTEEYVTENGVPVGHETRYLYNIDSMIDSILQVPSAAGTYTLQAVRTAAGITYEWVTT